jgi:hypothetical protein
VQLLDANPPGPCFADQRVNGAVVCPHGQLLVGGGFSGFSIANPNGINGGDAVYGNTAQGDEASWVIQLAASVFLSPGIPGGQGSVTLWAVCASTIAKNKLIPTDTPTALPPTRPRPTPTPTPTPTPLPAGPQAQLSVNPTGTQYVNCNVNPVIYPTLTVKNTGGQTLNGEAGVTNAQVMLSPTSGHLTGGQSQPVTLSQPSGGGGTDVRFTANGGSATISFQCLIG